MTRITQIDHEWLNIPMKSISVFRNRFDWAYRCNMHIAIVFLTLNYRIIYINTCNACSTPYKNGYVQHVCCAYGAVNAAHVQAVFMCRTCASYCHTSYMCNMHATCVRDMHCLHTCVLQVCCASVSCMYAYYYSAAYMPLAHMQATSVPHKCAACIYACYYSCIHTSYTCKLHQCSSYVQLAYMHVTTVLHTRCLHTCKLLVFLICAPCIHAYYYSAAYTLHHI